MIKYSFVVPIYNDGHVASMFCKEFEQVFIDYLKIPAIEEQVELIFVNDGSRDDSYRHLKKLAESYKFVTAIDLSRNFGQHIAISCGYKHAKGEFVGTIDVDMQEPPSEIIKLLKAFETSDCDIVVSVRSKRQSNWFKRLTSYSFKYVMNKLTGQESPLNSGTLRIMNRRFLDAYNQLKERSRYLAAHELWLGFKHCYVEINHQKECEGKKSSYNFKRRFNMALEAILTFSDRPLRMSVTVGFLCAAIGMLMGSFLVVQKLFLKDLQAGYTSTLSIILFIGGIQIFVTGLCGLYIGKILSEVQNRPLYIIRRIDKFQG
ncbi:MAG: glycosyltransferase family 2 protein [Pseudomonadota bacterium]